MDASTDGSQPAVSLGEATAVWARIGALSFGGPAAQIALMHRMIVEERRWLSEQQFLSALSFCMLLPGPEAMQLATYAGWRLHGTRGGLVAGLLFVLPGALVMLALGIIYAYFGGVPLISALFLGVKAAVLVIVIEALVRVAKKALHQTQHWVIAFLAFVGIFFLALPFPLLVLGAALFGFSFGKADGNEGPPPEIPVRVSKSIGTIALWLAIWWGPLLALTWLSGPQILTDLGWFFSKLAVVTFGGAYAVLAYMAQDVIGLHGWLTAGAMMGRTGSGGNNTRPSDPRHAICRLSVRLRAG